MKNLLYILLLLPVLIACKKNIVEELPPATQTGANTFGASVNGKLWVPSSAPIPGAAKLEARYITAGLIINARNLASTPTESEFEIFIKDLNGPGVYPLNQDAAVYPNHGPSYGYYISRTFTPVNQWLTSSQFTGVVTITLDDRVNHIISGTFHFDALNLFGTPDTLRVRDGRFDIKINF
jgi:hypothetical protein